MDNLPFDIKHRRVTVLCGLTQSNKCFNAHLKEFKIPCTPEHMMTLIRRGNIPTHYSERLEYNAVSHRMKPGEGSFYLKNNSVHINSYNKHFQLANCSFNYPDIDNALDVVRFEVQCLYPKIYAMSNTIRQHSRNISNSNLVFKMLSDEMCTDVIRDYYAKVIGGGDYFSLDNAKMRVAAQSFHKGKEARLIDALNLVNKCRGIHKAKAELQVDELEVFNRSLKDLSGIGINPVTIPREWNIRHIPNLLNAYFLTIEENDMDKVLFDDYLDECRKR